MATLAGRVGAARRGVRARWAGSLVLRTVLTTLGLSVIVVALVATVLVNRVSSGLLDAKQDRSLREATDDWERALLLLAAADAGAVTASPDRIVDGVVSDLARNAGSPPGYEILLLRAPSETASGPERATNLVSTQSVPRPLAAAVADEGAQMWTNTEAVFLDGARGPAMVVGAPVEVPGAGDYQLFHVFPYTEQQGIIGLVRSATLASGVFLIVLLVLLVWFVTRHVAVPIRQAATVAGQIAQGDLDQRIAVKGSDEVARLATSFNDMADGLQEQIEELEDLSRVQQRFVSDVSHELRTPLTTIRMASDLLHDRRDVVDADTGRAIELLAAQVDRFESLLQDLLEISRIDAGAADLDLEELDLTSLVDAVLASAAPIAAERMTPIRRSMPQEVTVVGDRRRLSRITRNLVTNALEYGAGKQVDVMVGVRDDVAGLGIRDRGPGVDPEQAKHVFDRFWRADPARARTLGGSGLGLSIAAEDAALQQAFLQIVSQPGAGTLFVLTLPGQHRNQPGSGPIPLDLNRFDELMAAARPGAGGS